MKDYIDSNIIAEILLEAKNKDVCEEYLYFFIKYKSSRGIISFLTLGEITKAIFKVNAEKRSLAFNKLLDRLKQIESVGFNEKTFQIVLELMNLDYRLKDEPADALHLAIAITNKASRFITLEDKKFNEVLRNYVSQKGTKIITLAPKKTLKFIY